MVSSALYAATSLKLNASSRSGLRLALSVLFDINVYYCHMIFYLARTARTLAHDRLRSFTTVPGHMFRHTYITALAPLFLAQHHCKNCPS
ncbi:uncharacterized protein BDZ99DRAFT_40316 [Mytilinidion resinicola]|uniref:Uncharacterized protein n=1 Tax=Mytilinidion resinicola TaxID=574789 RepID=A0A6A6YJV6_9PEZI|nr:uncharacterized protein BDZ99DRAFT_40316 [Mytilinidion resinicola]KAF2808813.1 hypothetical protein BDZ99DRAFT_40316 [Mytilinidion resinicola]